ncbi:hypothetical protein RGQ29_030901 [Quercus rubra]|uniref:Uncharacterized protein n=1 Tax=Quercus rubra TaxID=3512 RepID=A0AAN7IIM3_QUERU|nr:hypothetical protein RGQ29_030901 [Quercus rubra]
MSDHEDFGFVDTNGGREGRFLGLIRVCRGWLLPVKFGFYMTCAVRLRDEGKETDEN